MRGSRGQSDLSSTPRSVVVVSCPGAVQSDMEREIEELQGESDFPTERARGSAWCLKAVRFKYPCRARCHIFLGADFALTSIPFLTPLTQGTSVHHANFVVATYTHGSWWLLSMWTRLLNTRDRLGRDST